MMQNRQRLSPQLAHYHDLMKRLGGEAYQPPISPLASAAPNSIAFLLFACGVRTWHEVAEMAGCSLPDAERLGRAPLGKSAIRPADEAAYRKLTDVARQRCAAYAAAGHALSRILDRGEAKAIAERIRFGAGNRVKL